MMKHRLFVTILALGLLSVFGRSAQAQLSANQVASDELIRSAIVYLGYTPVTESDDPYVLAATLLDSAIELNPKNAQAWALRAELAERAGDQESYERALAGYLDTGIKDDRARFNLIRFRLSKNDTLDAQLRSLELLLNSDAGKALSGPLRSRVAGLASSIAGELLDTASQRRWAVEAARMDPANADAARVMRDLVIELGGDNVRLGTATVNMIRANPLDPSPRVELAMLLAQEAAFDRAAQQYQVVASRLSQQAMPMPAYLSWAQCLAMAGHDAPALQFIQDFEALLKGPPPAEGAVDKPAEGEALPDAKPIKLPLHFELIRLAVLDGVDDKDAAQATLDRIATRLKSIDEEKDADDQAKPEEAAGPSPEANLAMIAAAFGPDLEKAQALANAIKDDQASKDIALGWVALRRGEMPKADGLLRPFAGKDKLADAGLAIVLGQDAAGKARLLSAVIQQAPSSMAALAAGRALLKLDEKPKPTATGKTLTDLMGKYPESFWLIDVERTPWLEVRLKLNPQRILPMQPVQAEVTVWNTTRFPLAIGEEGPIRQQAMVLINATSSGLPTAPNPPIIIDLGRRFTLDAGERMIFDVRLDYHRFGTLRATNPGLPLVFDARLLVNPLLTRGGTWLAGGVGGVSEVRNCLIQSTPAKAEDIDRWLTAVKSTDATARLEALGRLAALSKKDQPELVGPAVLDRIRPVLLDVWQNGSGAERAWLIMNTRELEKESTSYPELYALATKSDDKLVWLALLSRQSDDDESEIVRIAIGRQDMPDISSFAERQRRLLRDLDAYIKEQERLRQEQQFNQPAGPNNP